MRPTPRLVEQLFASMGRNLTPPEGRERRTPRDAVSVPGTLL